MAKKAASSQESLSKATKSIASFSGHDAALGAAGYRMSSDHPDNCDFLEEPGQSIAVNVQHKNFKSIMIGAAWDSRIVQDAGFMGKWFGKTKKINVDLDIGCLYEMKDGTRGCIQAFGKKFGDYHSAPFMALSGDERTGDADGHDEYILVNGDHWDKVERILVYIYIYAGAARWSEITPQVVVDVPGENDLYVTLKAHNDDLQLCAIGELHNVRNGIKLTNRTEYFAGHEEMDRAFGYGLAWADGVKDE